MEGLHYVPASYVGLCKSAAVVIACTDENNFSGCFLSNMRGMQFFRYLPVDDKHHPEGEQHRADCKVSNDIIMLQWSILGRLVDNKTRNERSNAS